MNTRAKRTFVGIEKDGIGRPFIRSNHHVLATLRIPLLGTGLISSIKSPAISECQVADPSVRPEAPALQQAQPHLQTRIIPIAESG